MEVFVDIGMGIASRAQEPPQSEGSLRQFVEQNLSSFFPDLEAVASGFCVGVPVRDIDALVYDERQNCFAILACRDEINEYVLEQISKDHDALQANPGAASRAHAQRGRQDYTSYDWDKTYAIIVSQNFSNFEPRMCSRITFGLRLLKVSRFAGGIILLERTLESDGRAAPPKKTVKGYLDEKTGPKTRRLCQNIVRYVRKDLGLRVTPTSTHLLFKTHTGAMICALGATKTAVKISYNVQSPDPSFEGYSFIQNTHVTLHRKLGDYESNIATMYMFKKTIPFIKTVLSKHAKPESQSEAKPDRWVALSAVTDRSKKPAFMMCPDGTTVTVKSWSDLVFRMVVWLNKNEKLGLRHCPIKGGQRYILSGSAVHPNGKAFAKPRQTGPLYMETDYDSERMIRYASNIAKRAKVGLSGFRIKA